MIAAHRLEEPERRDELANAPASRHLGYDPADFFALSGREVANGPGQLEPVGPLARKYERRILSSSDQASTAHQDALPGTGLAKHGEKEDRRAIPCVLVLDHTVSEVTLALVDAEALGQGSLALLPGDGDTEVDGGPADLRKLLFDKADLDRLIESWKLPPLTPAPSPRYPGAPVRAGQR